MTWALVWKLLRGWWGGVAIGALGLLAVQVLWSARSTSEPGPTPYTAEPTKRAAEVPTVVEELPVVVVKPAPKVRERIAREYRQPGIVTPDRQPDQEVHAATGDLRSERDSSLADNWAKEILTEVRFDPAPAGGTALTTIDRATGLVETIVRPEPEPRISLRNRWELVGGFGLIEPPAPEPGREVSDAWEKFWQVEARWTPACARRLCSELAAGWLKVASEHGRAYGVVRPKLVGSR